MWLISCIVFYQKYDGANPLLLRAPPILSQPNFMVRYSFRPGLKAKSVQFVFHSTNKKPPAPKLN
jgi:hypothetical protein